MFFRKPWVWIFAFAGVQCKKKANFENQFNKKEEVGSSADEGLSTEEFMNQFEAESLEMDPVVKAVDEAAAYSQEDTSPTQTAPGGSGLILVAGVGIAVVATAIGIKNKQRVFDALDEARKFVQKNMGKKNVMVPPLPRRLTKQLNSVLDDLELDPKLKNLITGVLKGRKKGTSEQIEALRALGKAMPDNTPQQKKLFEDIFTLKTDPSEEALEQLAALTKNADTAARYKTLFMMPPSWRSSRYLKNIGDSFEALKAKLKVSSPQEALDDLIQRERFALDRMVRDLRLRGIDLDEIKLVNPQIAVRSGLHDMMAGLDGKSLEQSKDAISSFLDDYGDDVALIIGPKNPIEITRLPDQKNVISKNEEVIEEAKEFIQNLRAQVKQARSLDEIEGLLNTTFNRSKGELEKAVGFMGDRASLLGKWKQIKEMGGLDNVNKKQFETMLDVHFSDHMSHLVSMPKVANDANAQEGFQKAFFKMVETSKNHEIAWNVKRIEQGDFEIIEDAAKVVAAEKAKKLADVAN